VIYQADERKEDGLSCGGFDDCGFAHSRCVQIDICAFFRSFFLHIQIEKLYDVADKVW